MILGPSQRDMCNSLHRGGWGDANACDIYSCFIQALVPGSSDVAIGQLD